MVTIKQKALSYEVTFENGEVVTCASKERAIQQATKYGDEYRFIPREQYSDRVW